jgi:UDP-N-acetylmuramyl tripeptide synthase
MLRRGLRSGLWPPCKTYLPGAQAAGVHRFKSGSSEAVRGKAWLSRLRNYERSGIPQGAGSVTGTSWHLSSMHDLLRRVGSPHTELQHVVHVVGSKGKGSTVALLEAALQRQGLVVGAYTSPHLIAVEERIRLGVVPCYRTLSIVDLS